MKKSNQESLTAQPGPQTDFLSCPADIAIYGGAAGGGKSHALMLESMRNVLVPGFSAVIFRRTLADVKKPGSIWDASFELYGHIGKPRLDTLSWKFSANASITFSHLEHEKNVLDWQGAQVCLIGFDELTHFSRKQFFYMMSRNRSTCGVSPYMRATCNPDSDSWVADLISWWIDPDTGYAIAERGGVLRWFVRVGDELRWGDSIEEMLGMYPGSLPKSLTFIPSKLTDNKVLMDADPGYRANLLALDRVTRERLLNGNWKIRPSSGLYFQRHWCEIVDVIPAGTRFVRGWDIAATPKTEMNNPDFTCGTLIGQTPDGGFIVADHVWLQAAPQRVHAVMKATAERDKAKHGSVRIQIPQDPAAAGKAQVVVHKRLLAGYDCRFGVASGDKITRFEGFSAQADPGSSRGFGNVRVLRGPWNDRWFTQLESFPPEDNGHDDDADSTSEAFNGLVGAYGPGEALLELVRSGWQGSNPSAPVAAIEPPTITYAKGSQEYQEIVVADI